MIENNPSNVSSGFEMLLEEVEAEIDFFTLMAELVQTTKQPIGLHIHNIHAEKELRPEATHKQSLTVRQGAGGVRVAVVTDYFTTAFDGKSGVCTT